ncbi:ATP-binding protein [Mesorhizobium sp. KR2-14]|uniref:sensor histidine kinase n=1 Tax=Mesorhizobium sp. KR2-14 TaxID=3156610 RepID=UPI0032B34FF9
MALRLPAIMRTTAARLSALYLILFTLCAVVLVFYMTSLSSRMLTAQTMDTINEEVQGLGQSYQRGGLPFLVRTIERRARQPGANLYLIADSNGRILSGNVESLEPGVLSVDGWTERPFAYQRYGESSSERRSTDSSGSESVQEHVELRHKAIAVVLRLPNQMIILVGRDLSEPERFRVVVRRALMVALGMMGLGALLIWYFVGRRALKHIDSVSEASRRIMGGDLSGRLPVIGTGDEFDRLSENLNSMLERIAELNEGLKQVSDNIAHDLKTPLTRLRNRAEAALASQSSPAEHRAALESTIAESDQLIRTFNAILMISRLEAGYSAEAVGKVDLAAIVRDVVELYEPLAEEDGASLVASVGEGFVVHGNRELIGQALSNIVDNAIKYSLGSTDKPEVRVSLEKADKEVRLRVVDNGPGIPDQADRERATERFVRLEKSRSQPGSGLGLSLTKAVMKFHHGRLELAPADPGLSVTMIFPQREPGK